MGGVAIFCVWVGKKCLNEGGKTVFGIWCQKHFGVCRQNYVWGCGDKNVWQNLLAVLKNYM